MPRPKPETVVTSIRIPTELHREIKAEAAKNGESMEQYILDILSRREEVNWRRM